MGPEGVGRIVPYPVPFLRPNPVLLRNNMSKKTVNLNKLTREDITTENLQKATTDLLRVLTVRAEDDYTESMDKGLDDDVTNRDRERRDNLKNIYHNLSILRPRLVSGDDDE